MATLAPPPYTGNPAVDLKSSVGTETAKIAALSPDDKANTVAILNSPDNRKLIEEQIDKLCQRTQATRAAFEEISKLLDLFDSRKFKTKENKDIEPLRPGWEELRLRFKTLLDGSKTDATAIKVLCDDYRRNILSLLDDDPETMRMKMDEVKLELDGYKKRTEKSAGKAKTNADSFDKLRFDVELAKARIKDAFNSASADPTGRKTQLENEIKELGTKIVEAQKEIDGYLQALAVAGVISSVGSVLAAFIPAAGLLMAGAAAVATGYQNAAESKKKEMDGYKGEVENKKRELANIAEQEKILEQLRAQLLGSESHFGTIINQLTALATFWQAAAMDLTALMSHIDRASDKETTWRTFRNTLGPLLAGPIYIALGDALAKYISEMGKLEL